MCHKDVRWLILGIALLLIPIRGVAQESVGLNAPLRQRAFMEIENVIAEANSVTDKLVFIKVRAKIANLIWLQDRARSLKMFDELWAWVEEQDRKSFDREAARTEILKNLFLRNPEAATRLLEKLKMDGISPDSRQLNDLALGLIDADPTTAAGLLEQSLSNNLSPMNLTLLIQLRKRNVDAANGVASRILTTLNARPTVEALACAYSLIDYLFPSGGAPAASLTSATDDALRRQFFLTCYRILSRSLQMPDQHSQNPSPNEDRNAIFIKFCQAQLSGVLSALARRYAPERVSELNSLAARLSSGIPPQLSALAQYTLDRVNGRPYKPKDDSPAESLSAALISGNFDEAKRLLGKIEKEDVRKFYAYQIAVGEFKADMAQLNFTGALLVAKGVDDVPTRVDMFTQVIKAAYKKGDTLVPNQILVESRTSLKSVECGSKNVVAMFALAAVAAPISLGDSVELLNGGTACMNSLGVSASNSEKKAATDESHRFIDSQELQQAFSSLGKVDLDNALLSAGKIDDKPTSLIARLSACEMWLRAADNVTKTVPAKVNQAK